MNHDHAILILLLPLLPSNFLQFLLIILSTRGTPAPMFANARNVIITGNTSFNHYGNSYASGAAGDALDEGMLAPIRADSSKEMFMVPFQKALNCSFSMWRKAQCTTLENVLTRLPAIPKRASLSRKIFWAGQTNGPALSL